MSKRKRKHRQPDARATRKARNTGNPGPARSARQAQKARIRDLLAQLNLGPEDYWHRTEGGRRNLDAEEGFLRRVLAFETAPVTTLAKQLIEDGVELPSPDALGSEDVHGKLWEVIHGMARRHTYLVSTDHLGDGELYDVLWREILNEPVRELEEDATGRSVCEIDLVSDGSERSTWLYFRYYADDLARSDWQGEFPDDELPERIDPPHDRDRHLPKPPWSGNG